MRKILDKPMGLFNRKKDRDQHRYYLLPGMGRSNRRRHQQFIKWGLGVGLFVSALLSVLLYYANRF